MNLFFVGDKIEKENLKNKTELWGFFKLFGDFRRLRIGVFDNKTLENEHWALEDALVLLEQMCIFDKEQKYLELVNRRNFTKEINKNFDILENLLVEYSGFYRNPKIAYDTIQPYYLKYYDDNLDEHHVVINQKHITMLAKLSL